MRRDREPRGLTGETGVVIVSVGSALGDLAGSAMLAIGLTPHERFCARFVDTTAKVEVLVSSRRMQYLHHRILTVTRLHVAEDSRVLLLP